MTNKYKINSGYYFSGSDDASSVRCVSVESTDMVIYEFDDEVALTIIRALKTERTFSEICQAIEDEFEVDSDYKADVQEFLDEMVSKGIFDQLT
jgi:hypothetical protein